MAINASKTKMMIFNFSDKKFTTRVKLNNQNVEIVDQVKLLGTIVTSDLKWDRNTSEIVKKANTRMTILTKVAEFCPSVDELKNIYILFIRSLLEQSAVVWHSGLTKENESDLERVQKSAVKIILNNQYKNYKDALLKLDLEELSERRKSLCHKFAKKSIVTGKFNELFQKNDKKHTMKTRKSEVYKVTYARTEKLKRSSILYMQRLLNESN